MNCSQGSHIRRNDLGFEIQYRDLDKVVSHASVGGSICMLNRWASLAVIWDLGFSVRLHDLLFPNFVSDIIYSPLFPC